MDAKVTHRSPNVIWKTIIGVIDQLITGDHAEIQFWPFKMRSRETSS